MGKQICDVLLRNKSCGRVDGKGAVWPVAKDVIPSRVRALVVVPSKHFGRLSKVCVASSSGSTGKCFTEYRGTGLCRSVGFSLSAVSRYSSL